MKEINKGASNSYKIVTKLTYDDDTFYCKGINIEIVEGINNGSAKRLKRLKALRKSDI